jgi:predicted ATPase/DNA-binding winged helix-turn-helix (wHTH) protein
MKSIRKISEIRPKSLRSAVMTIYVLGPFSLDTQHDLLFDGGEPVALGRRAVALLRALVERPGAVVSKDALIEAAWPGLAVEDSNLTVQIAALRRALGKTPGGDRWIETMPRRGYRFIAPVVTQGEPGVMARPPADASPDFAPIQHAGAERRQITAVSCELTGMSARADEEGLEDFRTVISAFRRCVSAIVDRRDGFVVGYLGNAALILFGYPAAHEHDAERAVRAGMELCAAAGTLRLDAEMRVQCRVGIATGMAIIGDLDGDGSLQDREIIGAPPNLAMQVRLSAQPDSVAIEPVTRHLIGDLFDCRDLGTIDPAGHSEPMRVWQVLGESAVASRFEALRGPALTRLVGRDEEISLLQRLWARTKAGEGQVVLISGEAGLGKSRLTAVLEERLGAEPHARLRYFCSPYHQDSALFPVVDQLARASGFRPDDPPAYRREKLEALLAHVVPDEDVALLTDLLSLPASEHHKLSDLSPQRKKQRTLEALNRQLEGLARQQPVVVIFEDAHWIDATSRELLDRIVERARSLPVLLVVTFRPEFQPPWTGLPRVTMLALSRLDRRDRIALVTEVAGKALPDTVIDQIADRTDGIPLFLEELTKSVLESGLLRAETDRYVLDGALPPFGIPTSLYASLLARLDRPASVRLAAQAGAAVGREFAYALLRAVAGLAEDELLAALARLVASGLVFQRGMPPEAIYSFKHALVQDVAYGTLLRGARQQLHARIAQALEAQSPDLWETQPELFAQHYTEAGLVEKSVASWAKAGGRSAARSALAEAAAQYQKALDQLALLPDGPERLRQELEFRSALGALLRFVKGQAAPETGDTYTRTRELWEQLGSPLEFRHVPYGQSMYHVYRGELDLARRVGEELLNLSRQRNDSAGLVLGHSASGQSLLLAGGFAVSKPHLEELLAVYDPVSHGALVHRTGSHPLMTQAFLGLALFCLGFPDQAIARSNAAIADARRLAHPTSLAVSLAIGALHLSLAGDYAALDQRADELTAVAIEQGLPFYHAWGTIYRGYAKVKNGDLADGVSLLRSGVAAYRATGAVMWLPHFIALLAAGNEVAGQIEEAVGLLDEALRVVESTGERWFAAELNRHMGQLLLRQGHIEAAEGLYSKALSIAQEQDARLWELRAAACFARLRGEQGRHPEARDLLASVHGWFTEGFDTPDLKEAKATLDCIQAVPVATESSALLPASDGAGTIRTLRP